MKKIEKLKNSTLSRGLFAAKSAMRMLPSVISGETDPRKIFSDVIGQSIEQFVNDVGELKGSLLKAAQILSMYGEYYLPDEVNEVLKKVQSQGHYLPWEKISPLIPELFHQELIIEKNPIAAASIGQVHRARIRETGEGIVLKIQYPGIRKAIDLDIKMIKTLLNLGKVMPRKMNMEGIYSEIRRVLLEEMDYRKETEKHEEYFETMKGIPGVKVPKIFKRYCNDIIIASEFIDGRSLSEIEKLNLSQDERNRLGILLFRLFFKEVFGGNLIQTDCHAGNYLYDGRDVALIDFGACLHYETAELEKYRDLIRYTYLKDRESFFKALDLVAGKYEMNRDLLWEYCLLASSPLQETDYDWATTTLPDKISPKGLELVKTSKVETPPHQFIFLDRKLLGLFSVLRLLRARFNVKDIVKDFIV